MVAKMWSNMNFHSLLVEMQNSTATLEDSLVNILIIQSCNHTSLAFTKRSRKHVFTKICTWMFLAALFKIAQTLKQPGYPSVSEQINKLWYSQTIGYYSVLKINELSSHKKTWRKFPCILLSARGQSEKAAHGITQTMWHSEKGKLQKILKDQELPGFRRQRGINRWSTEDFKAVSYKLLRMMP